MRAMPKILLACIYDLRGAQARKTAESDAGTGLLWADSIEAQSGVVGLQLLSQERVPRSRRTSRGSATPEVEPTIRHLVSDAAC